MTGESRALLDALRRESSPVEGTCERGLALVEARIVADVEPTIEPPRTRELVRAGVIAIAIAAAVLLAIRGAAVGVAALRDEGDRPDAAGDVVDPARGGRAVPRDDRPRVEVASPPAVAPRTASVEPESVAPRVVTQRPEARREPDDAKPAISTDDLAAEAALVRAAKAERDAATSLALLDHHAREFPRGALGREREMLRAERLCTLGRATEARSVATRFLADGRDDPLARRMRKVCVDP